MNTETLKEPLTPLENGQDQRQSQEEVTGESILLGGNSNSPVQSNVATRQAAQLQPPAHTHVVNVRGQQYYQNRPFIIDDYLGPYFTPEGFEIQFNRLKPYLRFSLDILNERLEGKWYKIYQIYLLLASCLNLAPVVFFCAILKDYPALASVILVVFAHFGCALWQYYNEYKAIEYKDQNLSKKAILWMKSLYVVLTCLLIGIIIIAVICGCPIVFLIPVYIALFSLNMTILVAAYNIDEIFTNMKRLTNHLDNFTHLKSPLANDEERYKALFDLLYRLSKESVLFPNPNHYNIGAGAKDNSNEVAEVGKALETVVQSLTRMS